MASKNDNAEQILNKTSLLGYNFEMENLSSLLSQKFNQLIQFHNPVAPREWVGTRGFGVDLVFKVGKIWIYVEEAFCSRDYYFRNKWFNDSRLPRFLGKYPFPDKNHLWVILTNKPENFDSISKQAESWGIKILDIQGLIKLIKKLAKIFGVYPECNNNGIDVNSSSKDNISSKSNLNITNSKTNKQYNTKQYNVYYAPRIYDERIEKITSYNIKNQINELELLLKLRKLKDYKEFS